MPVLPGAEPFRLDAADPPAGVVLCHGFTGTPQSLRPWGEHLHAAGLTVHCPRLPGHGTRWQDLNATRWQDWYGEVERTLDALLERVPAVFAMGLSMGGTLSLRLAEQRGPDLAGIVLVNPSLASLRKELVLLPVLCRVIGSLPGVAGDIKLPGARELAYDRVPLRAMASVQQLWRTTRADLGRVDVPVRLYRSAVDHVVEPVSGEILLRGIASTDVAEVVLPDSYHVATLDNDAGVVFAGSVDFVSTRLAGGARSAGATGSGGPGGAPGTDVER